jgi:tripartite-type tricarboxylate transporter receptor subunit TctC
MRQVLHAFALAALALHATATFAQVAYPTRPIRLVVPFAAGSQADITARLVGAKLSDALKQPVIVEDMPGASGNIGGEYVARAPADGYTLLFGGSLMTLLPFTSAAPMVDPVAAYAPVAKLAEPPLVIVVGTAFDASTLAEVLARAKEKPGRIAYATLGIGSVNHLAMSMIARKAGVDLIHVPYANTPLAIKDVVAGEVPLVVTFLGPVNAHLQAGQVKAVAVVSTRRASAIPDVPTVVELGYPEAAMAPWNGILAPAGTPREIVRMLNREFATIVAQPDMRERFAQMGMTPLAPTPEQFAAEIREAVARWPAIVKAAGIEPK